MQPPPVVTEYAQTCLRYVQTSLGVALDFEPETLPLLDHYLRQARSDATRRPETIPLLAAVAGSYLGELLRLRHGGSWSADDPDPHAWFLQLAAAPVTVLPVVLALESITGETDPDVAPIQVADDLRQALTDHLANLPEVSEDDFLSPSTRVEVIDIAVDLLRAFRAARSGQTLDGVQGHIEPVVRVPDELDNDAPPATEDAEDTGDDPQQDDPPTRS